jgi:hypothetical protein
VDKLANHEVHQLYQNLLANDYKAAKSKIEEQVET